MPFMIIPLIVSAFRTGKAKAVQSGNPKAAAKLAKAEAKWADKEKKAGVKAAGKTAVRAAGHGDGLGEVAVAAICAKEEGVGDLFYTGLIAESTKASIQNAEFLSGRTMTGQERTFVQQVADIVQAAPETLNELRSKLPALAPSPLAYRASMDIINTGDPASMSWPEAVRRRLLDSLKYNPVYQVLDAVREAPGRAAKSAGVFFGIVAVGAIGLGAWYTYMVQAASAPRKKRKGAARRRR